MQGSKAMLSTEQCSTTRKRQGWRLLHLTSKRDTRRACFFAGKCIHDKLMLKVSYNCVTGSTKRIQHYTQYMQKKNPSGLGLWNLLLVQDGPGIEEKQMWSPRGRDGGEERQRERGKDRGRGEKGKVFNHSVITACEAYRQGWRQD